MRFDPRFTITGKIATSLMRIEGARRAVEDLPITTSVLARLRETARLYSTHYSTRIEGNRLTQEQVSHVIAEQKHFAGLERDEKEVLGYYAALERAEQFAKAGGPISELQIRTLHALVMSDGGRKVRPSAYRDGQNVIRDSRSGRIVYMPPEAKDVPVLMKAMVGWITSDRDAMPCPIRAAIAHYQFATIHPYYDGNGRTARLLTTLILHLGGYDLKGLYSLEEYYARNLNAYYEALTIGPSHNYYEGRAEADITGWVDYFCNGAAESFESVQRRAQEAEVTGARDQAAVLRGLDARQRKAIELFRIRDELTSRDVEELFGISQRAARNWLSSWVSEEFVVVIDPARKSRKYGLGLAYSGLVK